MASIPPASRHPRVRIYRAGPYVCSMPAACTQSRAPLTLTELCACLGVWIFTLAPGGYDTLQCYPRPCRRDAVWPSRPALEAMRAAIVGDGVTTPKVVGDSCPLPTCPYCGGGAFLSTLRCLCLSRSLPTPLTTPLKCRMERCHHSPLSMLLVGGAGMTRWCVGLCLNHNRRSRGLLVFGGPQEASQ
jgi:hypothetical protein